MKFLLALCLVAFASGIVNADESKGPKVTEKVCTVATLNQLLELSFGDKLKINSLINQGIIQYVCL